MRFGRLVTAITAVSALGLAGCAGTADEGGGSKVSGEINVFAAASLTDAFIEIAMDFERANPGTTVTLSFAGSSELATQINEGAPADVFASAAPKNMDTVTKAGNADGEPENFARNQLVIAVPKGNPDDIATLSDLADAKLKVAVCAEQVPCGAAAATALEAADVDLTPATQEKDVKAALSKLTLGEVDAALVYRTDAKTAAKEVDAVEFDESAEAINDYPIVVLKEAPNQTTAEAFVDYVRSKKGLDVLTEAGFQAP